MRRRQFITLLGAAAAWPTAAGAQQPAMPMVGFIYTGTSERGAINLTAFRKGLSEIGYVDGRDVTIESRWTDNQNDLLPAVAAEMVRRQVALIVATPVGAALAAVAVLRDPTQGSGTSQFAVIQAVAPSLRVEVNPLNLRDAGGTERAVAAFARSPNGGLIVAAGPAARLHRDLIITLAARHKLPAVYPQRSYVAAGGLISYGSDSVDQNRRAAGYVDRILRGEKPADLPVQAPTKYETVLNLKTAKALGITIPPDVLTRADEVIE